MIYKISNIAERKSIEKSFGCAYKHPLLYHPSAVIDGSKESIISIVTLEDPDAISFGIWGLLPSNYMGKWKDFQKAMNTLLVSQKQLRSHKIFSEAFSQRRCLVIVTGFFVYYLTGGELVPFFVHAPEGNVFSLAGIYNRLNDGFLTCSILTVTKPILLQKFRKSAPNVPVIVKKEDQDLWLNTEIDTKYLSHIMGNTANNLKVHAIEPEHCENDNKLMGLHRS